MTITTRTLAFAFKDAAGNNADGTVAFCPTTPFTNSGSNLTVARETQTVTLAAGAGSVTLYATDDADTSPTGATYTVTETITGADPRSYRIQVPAGSGTLQLADIAPAVSQPMYSYATTAALSALELDDLADVDAAAPTDGYFLKWVAADSEWQAAAGSGGGTVDVVSNVAADRILGRITSGSGDSEELTAAQVITLLNLAATYQPLDSDLTALAALTTTATGRALLEIANAAAGRTALDVPSNAEAILDALIDAKGDLIVGSAADTPAREAVGSNGHILRGMSTAANGVEWASEFSVGGTSLGMASALYYVTTLPNSTTAAMTQNLALYVPVWFGRACTLDRVGVAVSTNIASSVVRLGLYTSSNGLPTTLVADFGTVASATTGAKEITISQAVNGGLYWLAIVNQTAGGVVLRGNAGGYGLNAIGDSTLTAYSSGVQVTHYTQSSVSGALGASASVDAVRGAGAAPAVTVRAT